MGNLQRKHGAVLLVLGTVLCLVPGLAGLFGLRVNLTPSYPRGLWRIVQRDGAYRTGDVVFICAPANATFALAKARGYLPRGLCAGWTAPLIKKIVAGAGQRVLIGRQVSVDGVMIDHSAVQPFDAGGRPLQAARSGRVADGDVFLVAPHPYSFDSRYFGPVPASAILGLAQPVFVNGL